MEIGSDIYKNCLWRYQFIEEIEPGLNDGIFFEKKFNDSKDG